MHCEVSLKDSENSVDGRFSCCTKWRQQHDHTQLLAHDVTVIPRIRHIYTENCHQLTCCAVRVSRMLVRILKYS